MRICVFACTCVTDAMLDRLCVWLLLINVVRPVFHIKRAMHACVGCLLSPSCLHFSELYLLWLAICSDCCGLSARLSSAEDCLLRKYTRIWSEQRYFLINTLHCLVLFSS